MSRSGIRAKEIPNNGLAMGSNPTSLDACVGRCIWHAPTKSNKRKHLIKKSVRESDSQTEQNVV